MKSSSAAEPEGRSFQPRSVSSAEGRSRGSSNTRPVAPVETAGTVGETSAGAGSSSVFSAAVQSRGAAHGSRVRRRAEGRTVVPAQTTGGKYSKYLFRRNDPIYLDPMQTPDPMSSPVPAPVRAVAAAGGQATGPRGGPRAGARTGAGTGPRPKRPHVPSLVERGCGKGPSRRQSVGRHPPRAVPAPGGRDVDLYLKDESTHPTGVVEASPGAFTVPVRAVQRPDRRGTTVIEASSGRLPSREAYFARMLGLPFVAVMPRVERAEKIALIERDGGRAIWSTTPTTVYARRRGWRRDAAATTWTSSPTPSGPPTGAATTTSPSRSSPRWRWSGIPVPTWIVVGAGTGGTSATIGRYVRYAAGDTGSASSIRRTRRSSPAGVTTTRRCDGARLAHRGHRPARGWSRASCRARSTA